SASADPAFTCASASARASERSLDEAAYSCSSSGTASCALPRCMSTVAFSRWVSCFEGSTVVHAISRKKETAAVLAALMPAPESQETETKWGLSPFFSRLGLFQLAGHRRGPADSADGAAQLDDLLAHVLGE